MFDLYSCIRDEHDIWLVLLAVLVCLITSATAIFMLRQAAQASESARNSWLLAGGLATGFGIWSTHFIAMLGYDPGVAAGYQPFLTAASLIIVLLTTISGFRLALRSHRRYLALLSAVIAGGGFAAMHYVGMAALAMPARIIWDPVYVSLSILFAIVPLSFALRLAVAGRGLTSGAGATGLMILTIAGLHFIGMTAIRLIPDLMPDGSVLISPNEMSIMIGAASIFLLGLCIAGGVISRRTHAAIVQSQRQFSILIRGISDCAIYMLDHDGRIANWNAGAERLKGHREADVLGLPLSIFYTPEDRDGGLHTKALETARLHGKYTGEGWRVRSDGSRFWAHVTIEQVFDQSGKALGFAKITRDMTQFKEDQDRLAEATRQLDTALSHMNQGLCLFDADERLVLRNQRFAELWQLPVDSCTPGTALRDVVRAAIGARMQVAANDQSLEAMLQKLRASVANPDRGPIIEDFGADFCLSISSRSLPDGSWVSTFEDITERRRSEDRITHLAHHDLLTGLPNRTSFNRWMARESDIALARAEQVAVVAIDLDRFKEINDTHGHAIGDKVLTGFASAIECALSEGEIAARLGGDEFAVAKRFTAQSELSDFLTRLETAVRTCQGSPEAALHGASMGVAVLPGDATTTEALLNNADLAMYRAKAGHESMICFYEAGMDEKARKRRQLGNDLRQAIAKNELSILYQEQRSVLDQTLTGYEALLRWQHPVHGAVPPDEFIPIAEENGEIVPIGEWVLRTVCEEAATWPTDIKVAVNLSPVQLLKIELPETVAEILLQTGLPSRRLELEITETAIIADKSRALHLLRRIKALGVSVAMDDFGTGYSSLDTLHSFPFDKIKIDKSFLMQTDRSEQARTIVKAVLALGRSLSIPVLAEGVETKTQLDFLLNEGCQEAQGYYFGRPSPARSFATETGAPVRADQLARRAAR